MGAQGYEPSERRPIASRNWRVSQLIAEYLASRGVSPNAISLAGMMCGIAAGAALVATSYSGRWTWVTWLAAALLIQMRLLANLFDGMVAIASGRASAVGELYNEVPDRVSDAATLIGAGYAAGGIVALGYLAACAALFTAYIRAIGKAAGASQEFCGPMAKPQRMFVMTVVALYLSFSSQAWHPVWQLDSGSYGLPAAALLVITLGGLLTAIRRLLRISASLKKTG
jgi:phosphatidylglycerophosphate synthase